MARTRPAPRPRADFPPLPESVTDNRIGLVGVACALFALGLCLARPEMSAAAFVLVLIAAYALPVAVLETALLRTHRRASTGLDWSRPCRPDPGRVLTKLLGVTATVAAVLAAHGLFRVYAPAQLAVPFALFVALLPALAVVTPAYVAFVDGRQRSPHDIYWQIGAFLTGQRGAPELPALADHALGWTIKGIFLPIMVFYLHANGLRLDEIRAGLSGGLIELVVALTMVAIIVELTIVCTGYALTLRALDAHIRSPNPLIGAWVVTLVCYEPLNRIVTGVVLRYRTERDWAEVLPDYPILMWPWIVALLASFALWVWATAIFGLRWSNLTHRGIITGGPYRLTKHPDYVAKSAFFWLSAAPFLTATDAWTAVRATVAMLAVNLIYYGRARMEERHLSQDPAYVAYALAMNERSLFRGLARLLPLLRYRAPGARPEEAVVPDSEGPVAGGEHSA